ncbi:MAG: energy-coupling factor transporter ATPase [Methanolinea sp.]|nr:energy-coupling factor transporter ATPase [Methanolinea sp.]
MIELEGVSYAYPRTVKDAVSGISLSVRPGECIMITGPSGSGKTTLCMAAAGILEHEYGGKKTGTVTLFGKDVKEYKGISDISGHVGMVFDDPEAQLLFTTVEEELLSALERRGLSPDEVKARLDTVMEITHLTSLRNRAPHALSGGQKQRVVLAATLVLGTDILILDEPTAELDERGTESILSILRDLKTRGKTIILTEHKFARFRDLIDRLVVLEEGRIRSMGPSDSIEWDEYVRGVLFPDFSGIRDFAIPAMPPDRPPLITVRGLEYRYGDIPALRGVNLEIQPGEFIAIVGQNGSGKTTLIKHFIGLLRPSEGEVIVNGKDSKISAVSDLAHTVGLVFQNPDHMFFADTVEEEIAFGIDNLGIADKDRVLEEALQETGLVHARSLYPRWLSRGERQRLAIACVLAMQPQVIILDEPTTGLDGREAREIMELLKHLQRDGRTIVMVTHSRQIAEECADRVITMEEGRIISDTRGGPT